MGDAPVGLFIVPPVGAEKSQSQLFIKEVRRKEEEAIAEADEIYLIGWSLPKRIRTKYTSKMLGFKAATSNPLDDRCQSWGGARLLQASQ